MLLMILFISFSDIFDASCHFYYADYAYALCYAVTGYTLRISFIIFCHITITLIAITLSFIIHDTETATLILISSLLMSLLF